MRHAVVSASCERAIFGLAVADDDYSDTADVTWSCSVKTCFSDPHKCGIDFTAEHAALSTRTCPFGFGQQLNA